MHVSAHFAVVHISPVPANNWASSHLHRCAVAAAAAHIATYHSPHIEATTTTTTFNFVLRLIDEQQQQQRAKMQEPTKYQKQAYRCLFMPVRVSRTPLCNILGPLWRSRTNISNCAESACFNDRDMTFYLTRQQLRVEYLADRARARLSSLYFVSKSARCTARAQANCPPGDDNNDDSNGDGNETFRAEQELSLSR